MKIAVLTSSFPRFPGDGTAPFIKSIAEGYVNLGHTVYVIAPFDPSVQDSNVSGTLNIVWFRYIWPKSLNLIGHGRSLQGDAKLTPVAIMLVPFYLVFGIIALLRVCLKANIDIIHANWVLPNGPIAYAVSKLLKIPYVLSLHGSDIFVSNKNRLFSKIAQGIFSAASSITACSKDLMDAAIRLGASEEKIRLIAWGADPDIFSPENYSVEYRERNGISLNNILVVTAGRLVNKKGFDVLISAWETISEKFPNAILIIGGDGPLRDELIETTRDLGIENTIVFLGKINWKEMPKFLASADIFVLPSKRDSFGNLDGLPTILLEAMSSGVAPIASNIGGVPLVIKDSENGILVEADNCEDLVSAISKLVNNPQLRRKIGVTARLSIKKEFNWGKVALIFVDLFSSAIDSFRLKTQPNRLGSVYRRSLIKFLLKERPLKSKDFLLDVGCYDGISTRHINATHHIGIDIFPKVIYPEINYVQGDGRYLPFVKDCFHVVFALDVIEHIEEDHKLADQLKGALAPGGRLIITTPSEEIKLFPPFLTKWISKKWGHNIRLGYSKERLFALFKGEDYIISITEWNAPSFRAWYLAARILAPIFPGLISKWIERLAIKDYQNQIGNQGFWIIDVERKQKNQ